MPFDTGSVSYRMFYLRKDYDRDVVERFAANAAPPIETLGREPIRGWVTGRHLLDRDIREENCFHGGYLNVQLMQAEKKVPEALLRAYCKLEEEAEMKARDTTDLPRQVRAEIKARVMEQLLPDMPPTLTGIPTVLDLRNMQLLSSAMNDKAIERLTAYFRETCGETPIVVNPESAAMARRKVNTRDLSPTSFSPDDEIPPPEQLDLGMEFLTWLWNSVDGGQGSFELDDGSSYGVILEGPATFFGMPLEDGENAGGAVEAVLRKGTPLASREAGIALVCGKQLRSVKVTVARDDQIWSGTIDSSLAFRGLKLPKTLAFDPVGRFTTRMSMIEEFQSLVMALFDGFLDERVDKKQWDARVEAMREWASAKAG